jgi:hypothetical protein
MALNMQVKRIKSKQDLRALQEKNLRQHHAAASIAAWGPGMFTSTLDQPLRAFNSTGSLRQVEQDMDDEDPERMFVVQTIEGGNNSGKATVLRTRSAAECQTWVKALESAVTTEHIRVQAEADLARTPW